MDMQQYNIIQSMNILGWEETQTEGKMPNSIKPKRTNIEVEKSVWKIRFNILCTKFFVCSV